MAMARRGLFYTFLALYLRVQLGLTVTETTLLASLTMLANSASQVLIWGKISDKYQVRVRLIIIGEVIAALGYIGIYFFHIILLKSHGSIVAAYGIIAGLSIIECFWSMSNLGWSALISDLTTSKGRGKLMGITSSVGGIGRIVGISVSGFLYDWGGEGGGFSSGLLFFFASGIMLVSALIIWWSTRSSSIYPRSIPVPSQKPLSLKTFLTKSSNSFFWLLISIFIVSLGAYSLLHNFIFYIQLDSPIGATSLEIAMIRNSASFTTIITSLLATSLSGKIGKKNALGLGFGLWIVTPLLYLVAQTPFHMICINSLSGISMALMTVVGYLVASELIPVPYRGRLFGLYNAVTFISFGLAGTLLGGPVADLLISSGQTQASAYVITFQIAAVVSLIGTIIYVAKVHLSPNKR